MTNSYIILCINNTSIKRGLILQTSYLKCIHSNQTPPHLQLPCPRINHFQFFFKIICFIPPFLALSVLGIMY